MLCDQAVPIIRAFVNRRCYVIKQSPLFEFSLLGKYLMLFHFVMRTHSDTLKRDWRREPSIGSSYFFYTATSTICDRWFFTVIVRNSPDNVMVKYESMKAIPRSIENPWTVFINPCDTCPFNTRTLARTHARTHATCTHACTPPPPPSQSATVRPQRFSGFGSNRHRS